MERLDEVSVCKLHAVGSHRNSRTENCQCARAWWESPDELGRQWVCASLLWPSDRPDSSVQAHDKGDDLIVGFLLCLSDLSLTAQ